MSASAARVAARVIAMMNPEKQAWPHFLLQVDRMHKKITLTTYRPHADKSVMPSFLRELDAYFKREVLPQLEASGYTGGRMGVNNGVGEKNPLDPDYGMLIVAWNLEEMTEDHLVTLVEKAFSGLGAGPERF